MCYIIYFRETRTRTTNTTAQISHTNLSQFQVPNFVKINVSDIRININLLFIHGCFVDVALTHKFKTILEGSTYYIASAFYSCPIYDVPGNVTWWLTTKVKMYREAKIFFSWFS
jgi:hypothetical protein